MIWLMMACFILMMILGIPIAFSMGASAIMFIVAKGIPLSVATQRFFSNTQSFAFLAIPFFVLMGSLMVQAGIAKRIINFSDSLVRQFPGGLGCVSVITNMIMAGVSGSSVADCAAVGSVVIPEMKRTGYHSSFAASINASASVVGIIIPPSSTMIIIAWLTNLSVAKMFLAGVIPGALIGLMYLFITMMISIKRGYPRGKIATMKEIFNAIKSAIWALILPIVLIYVIVAGVATATEAAAVGAVYAFAIGVLVYRSLDLKKIVIALKETVYTTTVVMMIVSTASIFTWLLIREGIPQLISDFILGFGLSDWVLKIVLVLVMLAAGMIMDMVPNLFLFIPIFLPIATGIGMDPMQFSIIMLCSFAIGLFTPPVGTTLFISCYLAKIKIEDTYADLIPYFIGGIIAILLITFIPELTLWLPGIIMK